MRPPRGGLRPIHNKRQDVAKIELRVPAGGTVAVQDDVASQLLASGDFAEGEAPAGLLDALDVAHDLRFPEQVAEVVAAVDGAVPDAPTVKPRKASAKKA